MADQSHLDTLQRGVEAWNSWRAQNPTASPSLSEVDLTHSALVKTDLKGATLTGCRIYGISVWGTKLEGAKQWNLNISDANEPAIMMDNLEVAQFVYLLLNHRTLRNPAIHSECIAA